MLEIIVSKYNRKVLTLILISTLVRLILASSVELSNAEVYYWVFSQKLQLNYFDHPPVVAWLIRLTTLNLLAHSEVFVRLGAIISAGVCTWLIFKLGTVIQNNRTGWFAALLYTCSIYCSIVAGTFILPDSPQMVFWLGGILILIKISHLTEKGLQATLLWCLFGLISGLCIMSKAHGAFLWFGVILYALLINRKWLKFKGIYISAFITLLIVSPIFIWNFQNDFATYKFHGNRVAIIGQAVNISSFFHQLFQVIIVANPFNFILIFIGLYSIIKGKIPVIKKDIQLLLFCNIPLILILLIISLFRETMAHWPQPAYSSLCILAAMRLDFSQKIGNINIPLVLKFGLAHLVFIGLSEFLLISYYPGTLSKQKQGIYLGKDDTSLDMYGWKTTGEKFNSLYRTDVNKHIMKAGAPIIVTSWYPAAHIDFYVASKTKQKTIGIGNIADLHQYHWINADRKPLMHGENAYYIMPSNLFTYRALHMVASNFENSAPPDTIKILRSGIICKQLFVYRMMGYKRFK